MAVRWVIWMEWKLMVMVIILLTDWIKGKLLLIEPSGRAESLVDLPSGAADHEVIS